METDNQPSSEPERSYAKELGVEKGETKLLGLAWDKRRDTIGVTFPDVQPAAPTKRSILGAIAKIYDPLGLVSLVTLAGKTLYREACDLSIGWDKPLPDNLKVELLGAKPTSKGPSPEKSNSQLRRYQGD